MQIAEIIKRHGYTQTALADAMGIAKSTLSLILKKDSPTVETLRRMAQAMNISITEFFEDELPTYYPRPAPTEFVDTITVMGKRYGLVPLDGD